MRLRDPHVAPFRLHLALPAFLGVFLLGVFLLAAPHPAAAATQHMSFVGTLAPWDAGQYSNVAADAARGVAYLGSYDEQGVAVIDMRDRSNPQLTDRLSTLITNWISDSADLDLVGRYLAVSHQDLTFTDPPLGFEGISIYDTATDPFHPTLLRHIAVPGGVHTVQIDPEVENGRPYAYANSGGNFRMTVVNILTGEILSQYASSEGVGCIPYGSFCSGFNFAHEGFIQRHPRSGRVLDYVSYWDSGLRIVDVTDPRTPVEVGAYDYNIFTNGLRSAHYAAPTPSADWVYLEDEIGYLQAGGVHILDTHACDGTSYCTPVIVGGWDLPGRDVQTAALHRFFHHPNFNGSTVPFGNRSFVYDAHNLDCLGENTLLVANYKMGIRLIDTTDKTAPVQTAFYLPNSNMSVACKMDCGIVGRNTWGSYFGSDGLIYASDFDLGFFIVDPAGRGASAASALAAVGLDVPAAALSAAGLGSPAAALSARPLGTASEGGSRLRITRSGAGYEISFVGAVAGAGAVAVAGAVEGVGAVEGLGSVAGTGAVEGVARVAIYDVAGRRVAALDAIDRAGVTRAVHWTGRDESGARAARGIYLVKAESDGGRTIATGKILHLGG